MALLDFTGLVGVAIIRRNPYSGEEWFVDWVGESTTVVDVVPWDGWCEYYVDIVIGASAPNNGSGPPIRIYCIGGTHLALLAGKR